MRKIRRVLLVQLLALALTACVAYWLVQKYPIARSINDARRAVEAMGPWGALVYPLLFGAYNALLLPGGTVVSASSGLFFGLWWGFAINLAGSVLGAALSFAISRHLGRQWIRGKFLRRPRWALLDEAITREGWKIIFLSQLPPLFPTSLLQYLYGVTRIPFRTCMLWVAIGQMPTLFLYTYLGTLAQHGLGVLAGEKQPPVTDYILWIGGLILAASVAVLLGRLALRLLAEAKAKAALPPPPESPSPAPGKSAVHPL